MSIRLATDAEGEKIRDLIVDGYDEACRSFNWNKVYPYWIIAETEKDGIVACVLTLVGFPTGCIEFLSFKKDIPQTVKALAVKKLAKAALSAIYGAGCSAVFCTVPFGMTSWKKVMKNHWNGVILTSGNMFFKRLDHGA